MPTDDYIKKADAVFAVQKRIEQIGMGNNPLVCSIRQAVREAPAADVEPVRHGRWVPGDRFEYDGHGETVRNPGGITCSQCRYSFAEKYLWSRSYCPHCGAKMDAEPPKEENHGSV